MSPMSVLKTCKRCQASKPTDDFVTNSGKQSPSCYDCRLAWARSKAAEERRAAEAQARKDYAKELADHEEWLASPERERERQRKAEAFERQRPGWRAPRGRTGGLPSRQRRPSGGSWRNRCSPSWPRPGPIDSCTLHGTQVAE